MVADAARTDTKIETKSISPRFGLSPMASNEGYHCIICGTKYINNESCPGLFGTPCTFKLMALLSPISQLLRAIPAHTLSFPKSQSALPAPY